MNMLSDLALPPLSAPKISIVICNYNYGRFLEQSLSSALNQSYPCEVVVVDDGSTDNSREVLSKWFDQVQCVYQDNAGQRSAYWSGLKRSTGDIVIFLDSDDYLAPDAAAWVSQAFAENVVKAHFRLALVDAAGTRLGPTIPRRLANGDGFKRLVQHGLLYPSAPGSGNAYRRSVLEILFPLPEDEVERHAADFFVIYASAAFGLVRAIPEVLGYYRVHSAGTSPSSQFAFGNAVTHFDERERFKKRLEQFREWVAARTGGRVTVPSEVFDFSQTKSAFSDQVFQGNYQTSIRVGARLVPKLMRSLWYDEDFSISAKVALSVWAGAILLLPRKLGHPIARYVSNPASRGT
jgi:glycosyltransferase involved in cell wall biosynthesis